MACGSWSSCLNVLGVLLKRQANSSDLLVRADAKAAREALTEAIRLAVDCLAAAEAEAAAEADFTFKTFRSWRKKRELATRSNSTKNHISGCRLMSIFHIIA